MGVSCGPLPRRPRHPAGNAQAPEKRARENTKHTATLATTEVQRHPLQAPTSHRVSHRVSHPDPPLNLHPGLAGITRELTRTNHLSIESFYHPNGSCTSVTSLHWLQAASKPITFVPFMAGNVTFRRLCCQSGVSLLSVWCQSGVSLLLILLEWLRYMY